MVASKSWSPFSEVTKEYLPAKSVVATSYVFFKAILTPRKGLFLLSVIYPEIETCALLVQKASNKMMDNDFSFAVKFHNEHKVVYFINQIKLFILFFYFRGWKGRNYKCKYAFILLIIN